MSGDFDADARTKALESVPVLMIGDLTFNRRCRNRKVVLDVGHLVLRRDVASRRAEQARRHGREDEAAAHDQEALDTTLHIAAELLQDADGNPPDIALLRENAVAAAAVATDGIAEIQASREVLMHVASRLADATPTRPIDRGAPRRRVRPCNRARGSGRPRGRRVARSANAPPGEADEGEPGEARHTDLDLAGVR